jgi:hypothetical protein
MTAIRPNPAMSQVRTLKPDSFALIPMELIRVPEVKMIPATFDGNVFPRG